MRRPRSLWFWLTLALPACLGAAETRNVPRDFPTVKSAVLAASPGDTIEVEDGYYFEDSVNLDKPLTLRAKHPLRAVIYGSGAGFKSKAIFIIRSSVVIDGFVLKNGANGLLQRNSPDVDWVARNMAIFNMERSGVSINDPGNNIGRGRVENLIVGNCRFGIETDDAYGLDVENCFVEHCSSAFRAFNHVYFRVGHALIWDCGTVFDEALAPVVAPRNNMVRVGESVSVLDGPADFQTRMIEELSARPRFFGAPCFSGRDVPDESLSRGMFLAIAGDILHAKGDVRRPIRFYEEALRVGRQAGFEELEWRADFGLAACLESRGELRPALDHYRLALRVFEDLRGRFPFRLYNPGFFGDKLAVHLSLIRLLTEMHRRELAGGFLEEVFAVMELAKARGFMDSLEEAELGFSAKATPEIRQEEARITGMIALLQTELRNPYLSPRKHAQLDASLDEAEDMYNDLLIRIRRKLVGDGPRHYPEPLSYGEVRRRLLGDDTALIEYMLGQDFSVGLLVTSRNLSVILLPGKQEIGRLVGNYLGFLTFDPRRPFSAAKGGQRLNDLLLGPFQAELAKGIRKIIVVPDGQLFDLPFEALVDASGRFLVESCEFSYAHSASALVRLTERIRIRTAEDLLAVGTSQPPQPGSAIFGAIDRSSGLRYVAAELRAAARSYAWGKAHVLMDAQADESALKRLNWLDYRIVHFAVHGIFDDENWTRSCLLLWRNGSSHDDGYLQVRDILPLSLGSDLVVLSACQTAKGGFETGDGLIGLSNIFLFAGSRSVLVSQWNINDNSTAEFMKHFYESLASSLSASTALREAKIRMIRSRYRHPFHWAAFALIGCASGSYSSWNSREAQPSSRPLSSSALTVQR